MNLKNLLNTPFYIDLNSLEKRTEDLHHKQKNLILYPYQKEITIKHLDYWGINSLSIDDVHIFKDERGFFKINNLSRFKKYQIKMNLNFQMAAIGGTEMSSILGYKISQISLEAQKDKNLNQSMQVQNLLNKISLTSYKDLNQLETNDVLEFINLFKKIYTNNYEMIFTPFESILKSEMQNCIERILESRDYIDFINLHHIYMSIVDIYRREYLLLGLTV